MRDLQRGLADLLRVSKVVAVLVIEEAETAVPLASALVEGGVRLIEITLRSPAALRAIEAVMKNVSGAVVGAGTVLTARQFSDVENAGCSFAVSPGSTPRLLSAAAASNISWLPGASTVSEMMALQEEGYAIQKFFPAEQAGGAAFLKSLASLFPELRFCPTGGIDAGKASDYLSLSNVLCVGGSWIAPEALVKARNWSAIRDLAARASSTRQ